MMWAYLPESLSEALTSAQDRESALQHSALLDFAGLSSTLSETPTASDSSNNGSQTDGLTTPRCGTTQPHLTGDPGVDSWISSLAASRANLTALPASAEGPPTSVIFGPTSGGSFARWDPASSSWRTFQACLALTEGPCLAAYSGTWPRAGMTRSGTAYRLKPLAPLTGATGFGLLPTPAAHQMGSNETMRKHGTTLRRRVLAWPTPTAADVLVLGTTPEAIARADGLGQTVHLAQRVRWPTPAAREKGDGDYADPENGGSLNPTWTEWLQGWPLGWTDCAPLEMAGYHRWRQSLLQGLEGSDDA